MLWFSCIFTSVLLSILSLFSFNKNFRNYLVAKKKYKAGQMGFWKFECTKEITISSFLMLIMIIICSSAITGFILYDDYDESKNQMSYIHRYYYEQGYNSYVSETIEKSPPYWIDSYNKVWLDGYSSHSKN